MHDLCYVKSTLFLYDDLKKKENKNSTEKAGMETTSTASKLLVIGPGELGARVATIWKSKFPNAQITLK